MNPNSDSIPILPKEEVISNESHPTARFSRASEIEYYITNHKILQTIATKYNTSVLNPDAPTTSSAAKFYQKLNISERVDIDYGSFMEIDVQPDMRYVTQYFMFTTAKEYPDLDVKGYPYTSLASLVAYKLAIFSAYFLLCDLSYKNSKSQSAIPYVSDPAYIELLKLLRSRPVPEDVRTLLEYLAPVKDTQRYNLKFVPSFAGFSFIHDFGYTVPLHVFLLIHNVLATNRTNADPLVTMHKIYSIVIANIGNSEYTIANLFGGPFSNGTDQEVHKNWFSLALETFINPVVTRALVQRPTFAKTQVTVPRFDTEDELTGYDYLLSFPNINELLLDAFLTDVGRFYSDSQSNLVPLGSILAQSNGVTLLTHSIEQYVLPTWHKLPSITTTDLEKAPPNPTPITDTMYATVIGFNGAAPEFTGSFEFPDDPATIEIPLYRVEDKDYDPDKNPIPYRIFDPRLHVQSNVLWFQPYDKSSQSIELALTLGLKIISDEIDGLTIPLPDPKDDLMTNNSLFLQGSVPLSIVKGYMPSNDVGNSLPIYNRRKHRSASQPLGFSVRDCSANVLPYMANSLVRVPQPDKFGMTPEHNHNDPTEASTIVCWKSDEAPKLTKNRLRLWSSYRYVNYDCYSSQQSISFYFTLRALTGTSVTLSRTQHPSKLVPS